MSIGKAIEKWQREVEHSNTRKGLKEYVMFEAMIRPRDELIERLNGKISVLEADISYLKRELADLTMKLR